MLRDDKAVVGVKDGAQFVGVLTPAGIHRQLRESLSRPANADAPVSRWIPERVRQCNR